MIKNLLLFINLFTSLFGFLFRFISLTMQRGLVIIGFISILGVLYALFRFVLCFRVLESTLIWLWILCSIIWVIIITSEISKVSWEDILLFR